MALRSLSRPWWYSSDCARFFEAEITWSTVKRLTDNDMIEHVDLQNPGSFGKPAGQPDISFARRRIPTRMIVDEKCLNPSSINALTAAVMYPLPMAFRSLFPV